MTVPRGLLRLSLAAILLSTIAMAATARAADLAKAISPASKAVRDKVNLKAPDGCRHINGFNYQPSWGHDGATVWGEKFDAQKYRAELALGKKYFPKFNAVRIWLSWSAYRENRETCIRKFQQAVDICGELDLLVVPVIFNRWIGGPLWDRVKNQEITADFDKTFMPFIQALVVPMKGDQRILAWDLCNEPFIQDPQENKKRPVSLDMETQWLGKLRETVKQCDPDALICIGTMPNTQWLERTGHLQDILTPHLYYPLYRVAALRKLQASSTPVKLEDSVTRPEVVEKSFELAKKAGKPILCTECCWGALDDDAERARIVRTNLQALKQHGIGFFPHALWTSGVADLHKGGLYMPFILEDGSLRPGHEVYNEFAK